MSKKKSRGQGPGVGGQGLGVRGQKKLASQTVATNPKPAQENITSNLAEEEATTDSLSETAAPGSAQTENPPSPQPPTPNPQPLTPAPWPLTPYNLMLLGIVLLGAALRLFRLDYRSVWYDESFSIILARQDPATIINGTAHDYHPPLFYLLLSGWMKIFGEGILATRMLSVLFGLGAIVVVYLLAKALFGPKTALFAALFMAIAPFQVAYSQEVRMYSLQTLLGAWLCLAFYRAYRRDSWQDWVLFGLAALLSLYNLYFSFFGLAVLDLFFVSAIVYDKIVNRQSKIVNPKSLRWLVTNLAVALLYLPWLFFLLGQAGRVKNSYWISRPNPLEIFRLVDVYLYDATNLTVDTPFDLAGLLLAVFFLLFMLQASRFRLRKGEKGRARRSFEMGLMLTYWLAPALLVLLLSYVFTPIYLERSLIAFAVPCYILLARLVQNARRPNFWPVLLVPALALALVSFYFYFFTQEYSVHYDYASASRYISQNYHTGDIVLHTNKLSYLPFVYLKTPGQQVVVPEEPGNPHDDLSAETRQAIGLEYVPVEQAIEKLGQGGRVWLVLTPPQPGQTDYQERVVKGFLDRRYGGAATSANFYGATIFLYSEPPK